MQSILVIGGDPACCFERVAACETEAEAEAAARAYLERKGKGYAAAFEQRAFINRGGVVREVRS